MELLRHLLSPGASTYAEEVRALTWALIGLSAFFTLAVYFGVIYFAIRYRKGSKAPRENPPTHSRKLEAIWIGVPLVLALSVFVWSAWLYYKLFVPPAGAEQVYVLGKQWMWKMYRADGPAEINELHLPVGKPVILTFASQDVIHDFYVPDFHMKMDVVPGKFTQLWVTPTKVGRFYILCSQYCGTAHSDMVGEVIVMEEKDFNAWKKGTQPSESQLVAGEAVFKRLGCESCHNPYTSLAPSLRGVSGRTEKLADGRLVKVDDQYLRQAILTPGLAAVKGYPSRMPAYQGRLTEEELIQLVIYIKSLKTPEQSG